MFDHENSMRAGEPGRSSITITAMSYNVRNGHPDPGHEWNDRLPLVSDIIRRAAPDVLGMQEVLPRQLQGLRDALPEFELYGRTRDTTGSDESGPVAWRRDRFEARDAGQFWLSSDPDVPGANLWQGLCPRCATWVRLRERETGIEFIFSTTHLDHEENRHGDEVRLLSARLLAKRFSGLGIPVVLTGDFNDIPGSPPHVELTGSGFTDTRDDVGTDPALEPSFHDYGRGGTAGRIDWILRSTRIRTIGQHVDTTGAAIRASDHYPVVARLQLS